MIWRAAGMLTLPHIDVGRRGPSSRSPSLPGPRRSRVPGHDAEGGLNDTAEIRTVASPASCLGDTCRATLGLVTKSTSKLLEDALKLQAAERAELASVLLASLDAEADDDAEAAWAVEIEERAAQARSGEDPGKPWQEVRDRLERDLKHR